MTPRKCKQLAHEYIDTQLAKNPKWLDSITDSWYYESGAWFEEYVEKHENITIYSNPEDYDYTPEFESRINIFYGEIIKYKEQKEIEINGIRDGQLMIKGAIYDAKKMKEHIDEALKYLAGLYEGATLENPPLVSKGNFTTVANSVDNLIFVLETFNKKVLDAQKKMKKNNH